MSLGKLRKINKAKNIFHSPVTSCDTSETFQNLVKGGFNVQLSDGLLERFLSYRLSCFIIKVEIMQEQNCEGFSFPLNMEENKVRLVRLLTL